MIEGLLDDLSFEDLEKQVTQMKDDLEINCKNELLQKEDCKYDKSSVCNKECHYYKLCTRL